MVGGVGTQPLPPAELETKSVTSTAAPAGSVTPAGARPGPGGVGEVTSGGVSEADTGPTEHHTRCAGGVDEGTR